MAMNWAMLESLSVQEVAAALSGAGLAISIDPYLFRIRSEVDGLAEPLRVLYGDYPTAAGEAEFFDADIVLTRNRRGQVEFRWNGPTSFPELPHSQALPLLEWGLNWCIATMSGASIVMHAAVVERNGHALVLPGEPGSGKSTLCAELSLSGWRLLSDELTIIDPETRRIQPVPRPISLKEGSIDLIARRHPDATITDPISETRKGAIAYVKPPQAAIERRAEAVPLRTVLFPTFAADATEAEVEPVTRARTLAKLLDNCFNVGLLGHQGFEVLAEVVAGAESFQARYGDMSDVIAWLDRNCP